MTPLVRVSLWCEHTAVGCVDIADFSLDTTTEKTYHLTCPNNKSKIVGDILVKLDSKLKIAPRQLSCFSCHQTGFSDINRIAKSCIYDSPNLTDDFKIVIADNIQCIEMAHKSQYLIEMQAPFAETTPKGRSFSFWFRPSVDYLKAVKEDKDGVKDYLECNFPLLTYNAKYMTTMEDNLVNFTINAFNSVISEDEQVQMTSLTRSEFNKVVVLYRFGEWNNRVITWDRTAWKEYINGVKVPDSTYTVPSMPNRSLIGEKYVLFPALDGQIAEFTTWNGVLSENQIVTQYNEWIKNVKKITPRNETKGESVELIEMK